MEKLLSVFESWGDYLRFVAPAKQLPGCDFASRNGSHDFTSTYSFDEAFKLAQTGWFEGAEKSKKISEPIFNHVSSLMEKSDITHDVEGIQVDIARYLDGEPECWQQWVPTIVEGTGHRIVRLVFNGFVSASVPNETIERVGGTLVALIELLEYAGIRVEVMYDMVFTTQYTANYPINVEAHVKIKSADQPLDVPRLAFALAHPSSFRRIAFSFLEQHTAERRKLSQNYGGPHQVSLEGDITIPCLSYFNVDLQSQEKAEAWIIDQLKKQGVELKREVL